MTKTPCQLEPLEKLLHLKFNHPQLICNAFVHRSYLNESNQFTESNERLEYLGDAVLELATSVYLFKHYPQYQEGMLTNLRAALVKTSSLAELARKLGLPQYLLMSKGEEENGGRQNDSILADTTEALLGSIYLDQGFAAVQRILEKYLFPKTYQIIKNIEYKDSKSLLQEIAQAKFKQTPIYQLVSESGPDHDKKFIMQVIIGSQKYAQGEGKSKQAAQEAAAKRTLEMIKNN